MKKQYFTNLLCSLLFLACTSLVSCSNDDLKNEDIESGTRTITFNISQSFEESLDEEARGFLEKNDTVYQKFNDGMEIMTVIEQEQTTNSRSYTETVGVGTKVLAIIIDENDKIKDIQTLVVTDGYRLTCEVPNTKVRILFYSHNSQTTYPTVSLSIGDYISSNTVTAYIRYSQYAMLAKTNVILPGATSMGSIIFKHAFSRARMCLHNEKGVSVFRATIDNMSNTAATINMNEPYSIVERIPSNYENITFANETALNPAPKTLYSPYQPFIPREDVIPTNITLYSLNGNLIGKSTTITKAFNPGYSYIIHVYIKNSKIIDGWAYKFYQWDAKESFLPGDVPVPGDNKYYNTNLSSKIAVNSCVNCPTGEDILRMLAAGVYWDDFGPEWKDAAYNTYRTGVWVKKRQYWTSAIATSANVQGATDVQRNSDEYVFLPASGYINHNSTRLGVGSEGMYWSANKDQVEGAYHTASMLNFTSTTARITSQICIYGLTRWYIE